MPYAPSGSNRNKPTDQPNKQSTNQSTNQPTNHPSALRSLQIKSVVAVHLADGQFLLGENILKKEKAMMIMMMIITPIT
jgi:hypothetical protein